MFEERPTDDDHPDRLDAPGLVIGIALYGLIAAAAAGIGAAASVALAAP